MMSIVPDTPLKVTIAVAIAVIGSTATVSWVCANGLRDIKEDISSLRADLHVQQKQSWTIQDQKDWLYAFDKANRYSSIEVPTIPESKSYRKAN